MSDMSHLAGALVAGLAIAMTSASARAQASHYELGVRVEPATARMVVAGRWTTPVLDAPVQTFNFRLSPLMQELRIKWARCADEPLSVLRLEAKPDGGDTSWTMTTHTPCTAGRRLELAFSYESNGKTAPQLRIDPERGFAGSSGELWYPQRAFAERETARVTLDLPFGLEGIAVGERKSKTSQDGRTRLVFVQETPSKLAFAYGRYVERRIAGPVPIRVLTTESGVGAELTAERLARSLAPLASAFGPAPYRELALVEIDFQSLVAGTSEFGMIFADVSKIRGAYDLIYWAHEFGHQWWGNAVRPAAKTEGATLFTEGLAQYGALYALEQVEGAAAAEAYKREGGKARQSLAGYRALAAAGQDRPLVGPPPKAGDATLLGHRLATSKGALLIDHLSRLIGRESFHRSLARFVKENAGSLTSWAALEAEINRATDNRHAAEIRSWFTDAGEPEPLRALGASTLQP